jgi:toxin-antitoxin system PIN domain toxin
MKLADTNIWLALVFSKHIFHDAAQAWLDAETKDQEIAFCRATQQSLLRLLTTAAMVKPYGALPFTNAQAWTLCEQYLADRRITTVEEPKGLDAHWMVFTTRDKASPKIWMDAYLAAFAIAAGHQLVTTDKGFAQYKGLDLVVLSSKGAATP